MVDIKAETKTTYTLSKNDVKELIIAKLGCSPTASIEFKCRGGDDGYGGWAKMDLDSVKVVSTVRSLPFSDPYP